MGMIFYDADAIRRAIAQLVTPGQCFECRIIRSSKKKPASGYFKSVDALIEALGKMDLRHANVYITLQQVKNECFARIQSDRFVDGAASTADGDIEGYNWLFIDLDPVRASGISSSEEELQEAYKLAGKVADYMRGLGFYDPVKAVSGNGAHLLYRIKLGSTPENADLLKRALEALASLFDNDKVKIDTVNFNPSRICKLYGTLAQKGTATEERPFRMAYLLNEVHHVETNSKVYIERLAKQAPEMESQHPEPFNNFSPSEFDVENWLSGHGLQYSIKPYRGGVRYVLDTCPFDSSHTAPDAAVFKDANGRLGFKCLHNSCADKGWKDVRMKFEPDAYERKQNEADKRIEEGWKHYNRNKQKTEELAPKPGASMFLRMADIEEMDIPEVEYVRTGIVAIDKKMKGLGKGEVSVVSGLRGAAKSTVLSQISLNAVNNGYNVVCYSGELTYKNFWKWLCMQAAGKHHVIKQNKYEDFWEIESKATSKRIAEWFDSKLWLYNNDYGNSFKTIKGELMQVLNNSQADLCILDNLMALDLSGYDNDKYEAQTKFIWELKNIAKLCNVHIIFVAHPRKAGGFLRLDDISGTGNIGNIVDNAFIVHRTNEDFKRLSKQMFGYKDDHPVYSGTNVIEVCKNRSEGVQDLFIPLWFEIPSKRILNCAAEYIRYGWEPKEEPKEPEERPF